jgi:hypothetical protein
MRCSLWRTTDTFPELNLNRTAKWSSQQKENMKTRNNWSLLAVIAAAFSLNVSTSSGQVFDSVEALNNRAVAASPRAKEAFPWLTRSSAVIPTKTAVSDVTKNRAFAASPRTLEQFPELARPVQPVKSTGSSVAATVLKNRALAASPRAREEFPWLARGSFTVTEEPFQIAPLK